MAGSTCPQRSGATGCHGITSMRASARSISRDESMLVSGTTRTCTSRLVCLRPEGGILMNSSHHSGCGQTSTKSTHRLLLLRESYRRLLGSLHLGGFKLCGDLTEGYLRSHSTSSIKAYPIFLEPTREGGTG